MNAVHLVCSGSPPLAVRILFRRIHGSPDRIGAADEKFFHTGKHLILDSEKSKLKLELLYMQEEERTLCVKRRIEANTSWRRVSLD